MHGLYPLPWRTQGSPILPLTVNEKRKTLPEGKGTRGASSPAPPLQPWHSPADLGCPVWLDPTGNSFKILCFPLIITWWKSRNHQEIQLQLMCYWWPGWGFLGLIRLLQPHLEPPLGTHRSWAGPTFSPGCSSTTASLARSPRSL